MKIITISGKARNGKDTAAQMIMECIKKSEPTQSVLITHYADLLKFICKNYFHWDGKKDDTGRWLLQMVGTDVIRKQDPDFWVNFVIKILSLFDTVWNTVIIPDTRFPNEIDRLKEFGHDVLHIKVERDGFNSELTDEQKNHPSETALDDREPDVLLKNIGDLAEYRKRIEKTFKEMIQKWLREENILG